MREGGAPAGVAGFDLDVSHGSGVVVVDTKLATALGLADIHPIGATLSGSVGTGHVTLGLEELEVSSIAVLPVLCQRIATSELALDSQLRVELALSESVIAPGWWAKSGR